MIGHTGGETGFMSPVDVPFLQGLLAIEKINEAGVILGKQIELVAFQSLLRGVLISVFGEVLRRVEQGSLLGLITIPSSPGLARVGMGVLPLVILIRRPRRSRSGPRAIRATHHAKAP